MTTNTKPATQITLDRESLADAKPGDLIVSIDGKPLRDPVTITAALAALPGTDVQAIQVKAPWRAEAFNLYPDSVVGESITVERATPAKTYATDRKNASHIDVGDTLIVVPNPLAGFIPTRRVTRVQTVKVTGKRKHGYRCYILSTTGGDITTPAAQVFGIL